MKEYRQERKTKEEEKRNRERRDECRDKRAEVREITARGSASHLAEYHRGACIACIGCAITSTSWDMPYRISAEYDSSPYS